MCPSFTYIGEKMKSIILGPRLKTAANMVRKGTKVADIGTDHAYLIAYLLTNDICTFGYACDINPNPLKKAESTIKENFLENKARLVLCDGLAGLSREMAEDIVVAGMGGETIISILENCSWSKDKSKHYILQPMTKSSVLRRYLCENGFEIQEERAVKDSCRIYTVMSVYYTGEITSPNSVFCEIGKLSYKKDAESVEYIKNRAAAILKKADGLAKTDSKSAKDAYELYQNIVRCL